MGWSLQNIIARVVIIEGANDGLFVYNGPPAFGNLVTSVAAMAGTDRFGNAYLADTATYFQFTPGAWMASQHGAGGLAWYTASSAAGPWTLRTTLLGTQPTLSAGVLPQSSYGLAFSDTTGNPRAATIAPSGDATGTKDAALIVALYNLGAKHVRLQPSTPANPWYIKANQVVGTTGQYLSGHGAYVVGVGTGDVFRWVDTTTYTTRNPAGGGGVLGFPLTDLSGMGAGSIGYHAGDILQLRSEVMVQNATGAGSWGVLFDNQNFFTEQAYTRTWTKNCTNHVGYQFGGSGTNSFARTDAVHYIAQGNVVNNGVVLGAGVNVYDTVQFVITGNFTGGASGSPGAAFTLGANALLEGHLDITPETGTGVVQPQTINFGAGSIIDAIGYIRFSGSGSWTSSNIVASGAQFTFNGPIRGTDFSLVSTVTYGTSAQGALGTGGTIKTNAGGNVSVNPAGAVTGIIMQPGVNDGQEVWVVNESANLITFAVAATSNVAAGASATVPAFGNEPFKWRTPTSRWYGGV